MKNQYVGDIGDYGKYGLLRFLAERGIRLGVNWYLTPDDGSNDGKFTGYLKKGRERCHDEELFDFLATVAEREDKTVAMIEEAGIIPQAVFYDRVVGEGGRKVWHEAALAALEGAELVFCDPDNGPLGKKSLSARNADKYVAPTEIADYYNRGQNVVYYCQKARRSMAAWMETKLEMTKYLPDAKIYVLTYHRGTQRSYIFVLHPADYGKYARIFGDFERTSWGWHSNRLFTRELFPDGESYL